jgi:hypothetical protein
MAEKIISPGVFTKEIDASFLPAVIGDIGAVVVGPTVKGPSLSPTVVTSYAEYQAKFGDSFKSGSGYYQYLTSHTAKNYLEHAGRLTVVRIMGAGYGEATASIVTAGTDNSSFATGSLLCTAGDISASDEFQITVAGTEYRFIASDPAGGVPVSSTPTFYFATGSNLGTGLGLLTASINTAGIGVRATSPSSSLGQTTLFLSASSAGTAGNSISVDTGSGTNMVDALTLEGGLDSTTGAETVLKLHTLSDGVILNSDQGSIGTNQVLSNGTSNNLRWEVSSKNNKKGTFNLLIRRGDDTIKQKQIIETWNNLSLDPNASNYVDKVIGDQDITINQTDTSDPFLTYSGSYQNKSKYVRVATVKQTVDYLDENGEIRDTDASGSLPGLGSGSLGGVFGGGLDGTTTHPINFNETITNTNSQGFNLSVSAVKDQYTVALNLLSNNDEYDFNLLLLPGIIRNLSNHTSIITKAIDVCEQRGDAFVVVDSVDYGTNSLTTVNAQAKAMNSNYAATYWPWVQAPDSQTGQNVWVPPSVVMAGVYSYSDKVAAPWFAPAGLGRGIISTAVQAKRKLTQKNRDTLYENNVNPIATFPGQGIVVWGQKTLQKKASALDRVNVRRLLIKVKKFIASSSRFLVFEQNNAQTRERFLNIANPYLEQVQSNSGLNAFKVVMDESNNTPDVVDRNILYGQIFLQPTKTAEFIVLDFTVQPTGATFPE